MFKNGFADINKAFTLLIAVFVFVCFTSLSHAQDEGGEGGGEGAEGESCNMEFIEQDVSLTVFQGTQISPHSLGGYSHGVDCERNKMKLLCTFDFVHIEPVSFEIDPGHTKPLTAVYNMSRLGVGTFSTSCSIHGETTEPLVANYANFEIFVIPLSNKNFTFKCDKRLKFWPVNEIERLELELGDTEKCVTRVINFNPNREVKIATSMRKGFRQAIKVEPEAAVSGKNGEIEFTITALKRGIEWVGWAVADDDGRFKFNKKAYDDGRAWGMFIEVR